MITSLNLLLVLTFDSKRGLSPANMTRIYDLRGTYKLVSHFMH